jgi:tRNA U34 5-methylaminomethyl-2-thiouridine-forming methyltransferase MnmC
MHSPTHPYSPHFSEHYWSGGAPEKTHVYLHGNDLPTRFAGATENNQPFTVAELGFGTALTFLLTAHLWRQTGASDALLTFISYESHPLTRTELATIHTAFPSGLHSLSQAFLPLYDPQPGWNLLTLENTTLHLYVGDAQTGLKTNPTAADAWFLDGFSPANNPDLWTPEVLNLVAAHSKPQATATTYSVASMVKTNLIDAGFQIEKIKGHPPKQYMLKAIKI